MKIAVDGRPLQGQLSGIGKYLLQLILNLTKLIPDSEIIIFTNKPVEITFESSNITLIEDLRYKKIKPLIWSKFFLSRLLKKEEFNFVLFGGTFTPIQKLLSKKIVVVHDLNHIYAKETMSKMHYITHLLFFKNDIGNAEYIISNSHGTGEKLKKQYGIVSDYTIHPPIDDSYKIIDDNEVKEVLKDLGISYPYILTVATQEPRKNLEKTITAFLQLKSNKLINGYKLVLAGGKGWKNDELQKLINSDNDIIQLGYVQEKHLPYLYNGAASFVFPSKYEGYGMPASEAVLCGLKPVVTNITELHEATAGHAYFIDPENNDNYSDCIVKSIKNKSPYENLARKQLRENHEKELTFFVGLFKSKNL